MPEADPYSPKHFFRKHYLKLIIALVVLILIGVSYYFFNQYKSSKNLLQGNQTSHNENGELIQQVGKLMLLPSEQPTIFNVSDKTKLTNEPFFKNSENGDKVLIYQKAKIAILFRPSINKIVQVSSINLEQNSTSSSENSISPTPVAKSISVTIYNGTTITGLAKSAGSKITSKYPDYTISTGDSSLGDYSNTIVINLNGENSKEASDLASLLGGKVQSQIPSGETKPNTEILVILGNDYNK